jgi:hypothetical protein
MANTTFNGPVRSTKGFQIATRDASSDVETTRMSSGMPDLTGLTLTDTGYCYKYYFSRQLIKCS